MWIKYFVLKRLVASTISIATEKKGQRNYKWNTWSDFRVNTTDIYAIYAILSRMRLQWNLRQKIACRRDNYFIANNKFRERFVWSICDILFCVKPPQKWFRCKDFFAVRNEMITKNKQLATIPFGFKLKRQQWEKYI